MKAAKHGPLYDRLTPAYEAAAAVQKKVEWRSTMRRQRPLRMARDDLRHPEAHYYRNMGEMEFLADQMTGEGDAKVGPWLLSLIASATVAQGLAALRYCTSMTDAARMLCGDYDYTPQTEPEKAARVKLLVSLLSVVTPEELSRLLTYRGRNGARLRQDILLHLDSVPTTSRP